MSTLEQPYHNTISAEKHLYIYIHIYIYIYDATQEVTCGVVMAVGASRNTQLFETAISDMRSGGGIRKVSAGTATSRVSQSEALAISPATVNIYQ